MSITRSATKALRVSLRRRVFNLRRKRVMTEAIKKIRRLVQAGKVQEAQAALPQAYQAIDKAAKRGVIKQNTAARKKSRLARLLHQVAQA